MKKILLGILGLLIVSCGQQQVKNKDQITVAIASSPVTKDAHKVTDNMSRAVITHIYDTLLQIDSTGKLIPGLATSWEYLSPTNLQLKLREGVTFHNGESFTAKDAIANLERLKITPESQAMYNKISKLSAPDDYTLNIELSTPFPSIIGYLSHVKSGIYPKSLIDQIGTNAIETPIGTGPYMYEEWIHGDRITLKANPNYWDGVPAIQTMIFKVILDESVRAISIETGDVQVVMDVAPTHREELQDIPTVDLVRFDHIGPDYLGFNMIAPSLQNLRLREAITMAIDKQAIIDSVFFGMGKPSFTLFDDRMFGALTDEDTLTYDPVAAKKIIEEEGLTGLKLSLIANEGLRSKTAEIIQSYLKEIGLDITITILEWGTYLDYLRQGTHELYLLGWSNSTFDPDDSLSAIYHTDSIKVNANNNFYSNPQVDKLIEKAQVEINPEVRANYYKEAQRIIRNDRANVFLLFKSYTLAFEKGLEGVILLPTGDHKLHKLQYKL